MGGNILKNTLPPEVISRVGAVKTETIANNLVSMGRVFTIGKRFEIAGGAEKILTIDPVGYSGNFVVFLPLAINGVGDRVEIDIIVDPTFNMDGTVLTPINRRSDTGIVSQLETREDPTGFTGGTVGIELLLPSDGSPIFSNTGATAEQSVPFFLDLSKKYAVRLTNAGVQTAFLGFSASWFEI